MDTHTTIDKTALTVTTTITMSVSDASKFLYDAEIVDRVDQLAPDEKRMILSTPLLRDNASAALRTITEFGLATSKGMAVDVIMAELGIDVADLASEG